MSAVSAPYGFRPLRYADSGLRVGTRTRTGGIASGYATAIGLGDPIKMLTDGTFALAAAGDLISGVFAGWQSNDEATFLKGPNWIASTTWTVPPTVLWYPINGVLFAVQGVGSIAQTAIGDAADHVVGTVNARSGHSTSYLASGSLVGAAASAGWKIQNVYAIPGNAWGDTYTEVEVIVNEVNLGGIAGNAI